MVSLDSGEFGNTHHQVVSRVMGVSVCVGDRPVEDDDVDESAALKRVSWNPPQLTTGGPPNPPQRSDSECPRGTDH